MVPDLIRESIVEGCGFQPRDEASQVRHLVGLRAT